MQRAGDVDDRAAAEKRRDRSGIERRRHHQDAQIGARQPRLPRQREAEIGVHAALVELIDDERRDVAQQRIVLQVGGEDAFGDDEQPRVAGELPLETDVPADLAADGPAAFLGDPPRHGARGDAPRLQQQHAAAIDQRRRHARRLAGAGRRGQHRGTVAVERGANGVESRINRQRPAARSIIKAYRQGYSPIHGELRNTLEPDPVQTGGGRAEMSKSTPVPTANTFAEAFPNSTKVFDETFVETPNGRVDLRVPVREVR